MGGNRKVIPSAITILDDGTAYIGDAAFNPEVLKKATVRVCFKQAPKDINGEAEKVMIRFMHEVYIRIRENNQALLQEGNHLVYIATPSGWNKEQQALYVQMAEAAGIPIAGVTKESRAAFVRAQQDTTSGLGKNIHKGAIVFDMGSSTLDFTYMNDANDNLIDYGYDCGASLVEKTIYGIKHDEVEAVRTFETKYPKLVDYLLFQARAAKEKVYFDPSLPYKKTINFEDIVDDEELEDDDPTKEAAARVYDIAHTADAEIREKINEVFGKDVCTPTIGSRSILMPAKGLPVWENMLLAIIDKFDSQLIEEKAKTNPRLEEYTKKYRGIRKKR